MIHRKPQLAAMAAQVDALTLRERISVFVAILAVLLFIWNYFVNGSLAVERSQLTQKQTAIETREQALKQAAAEIRARAGVDPDAVTRRQLTALTAELERLKTGQRELARSFIPPGLMAELLRNLLTRSGSLQLVSLATQPAAPLVTDDATKDDRPPIYRHDLTIEFEGGYFEILDYLRLLEKQPLFFDSIDYKVSAHPKATISLRVYTLSFEPEWLGV